MSVRRVEGAGSIARVWRAEGLAAVRDRAWDRVRDAVLRARCVNGGSAPWPAAPVLNVIGVPLTTVFGGVPVQLRARLRHESMQRPIALLCREPGGSAGAGSTAMAPTETAATTGPGTGTATLRGTSSLAGTAALPGVAASPRAAATSGIAATAGSTATPDRAVTPGRVTMGTAGMTGTGVTSGTSAAAGTVAASAGPGAGWRLEAWIDGRPCRAMAFPAGDWDGDPLRDDPAWLDAVRTCLRLVNARAIHVENAAGLSLVALSSLMDTGAATDGPRVPVVLSVHDLALFSRDPQPLRADAQALESPEAPEPRESPASAGARARARDDDRHRLEHALHHALGTGIVRAAAFTIYPSRFMRQHIEALPHRPAHVVAPGIEPPDTRSRSPRRPDQIALLGGGAKHKGGARLARIAAALAARGLQVTSYGGYGHEHLLQMRGIAGVRVRGYYRAGSLPGLLARQGAAVALILSAFDESFSLVLSEAWAAGVPVVAPATGAFPERVGTEGGLLIPINATDEEIVAAVDRARSMPWDALPAPPTAAQAAERHLALYREAGFIAAATNS